MLVLGFFEGGGAVLPEDELLETVDDGRPSSETAAPMAVKFTFSPRSRQ